MSVYYSLVLSLLVFVFFLRLSLSLSSSLCFLLLMLKSCWVLAVPLLGASGYGVGTAGHLYSRWILARWWLLLGRRITTPEGFSREVHAWMKELMYGWLNVGMKGNWNEQINETERTLRHCLLNEQIKEWIEAVNEWMNEWMNETNEWINECINL